MIKARLLSTVSWSTMLAVGGALSGAQASPIIAGQSITPGTNVSTSTSYAGQFDLTGLLPAGTNFNNVSAVSGFITAYGYSAAAATTSHSYTGYSATSSYTYYVIAGYYSYTYYAGHYSYSCGWNGWDTCYAPYYATGYSPYYASIRERDYIRNHTESVQDLIDDTMLLTVGGQSEQDDTDLEQRDFVYNGTTHVSYYNGYYNRNTYRQREYVDTDILSGPLEITMALDSDNLDDLGDDGILDFFISSMAGQFTLDSVSISAEFQQQSVAVSGPASTAITAAVVAMLMGKRRRARRRTAAQL